MFDGLVHGPSGNFIKHHPVHLLAVQYATFFQQFIQVPGDGFPLPVRVGGQVQGSGGFQCPGDGGHMFLVFPDHLIFHFKIVIGVHCPILGHQITHVPVGGQYAKVLAKVFLDGAGPLGRGFNNNQVFTHAAGRLNVMGARL